MTDQPVEEKPLLVQTKHCHSFFLFSDLDLERSKHFKTIERDKHLQFGCQPRKRLIRKQEIRQLLQLLQLLQEILKEHYSVTQIYCL